MRRQFTLHALCCGQRFRSDPVAVAVDPAFDETFTIDLMPAVDAGMAALDAENPGIPRAHVSPLLALLHSEVTTCGLHLLLTLESLPCEPAAVADLARGNYVKAAQQSGLPAVAEPPPVTFAEGRRFDEPDYSRDGGAVASPGSQAKQGISSASVELVASQTLDWRLLLSEPNGFMATMVRLVPAGAGAAPVYSASPGDISLPVGLLACELSLEPPIEEGGALLRAGACIEKGIEGYCSIRTVPLHARCRRQARGRTPGGSVSREVACVF